MPTDDCRLRFEVTSADRDVVRRIVASTGFFRPDEVDVAVELVDEHLTHGGDSGYFFVFAEVDRTPIGYACYGPIPCTTSSFDLYWIAIVPSWQRRGAGRMLLSAVECQIATAGGERIYIDTSGQPKYASSRAFYERNGYQAAARLADFYAPGDDRVIYAKVLNPSVRLSEVPRPLALENQAVRNSDSRPA
jgi:GNAT superfamily N-acetyltransferase